MKRDCRGNELREHKKYYGISRFGTSTCEIICPFCKETIIAYIWSLAGCGKRCYCGVIHSSFNITRDDKNIYGGRQTKEDIRNNLKVGLESN